VTTAGYLRHPAIWGNDIVFVAEDDLWTVSADGGRAWRITAGVGEVSTPCFSPDGTKLAFVGREEGPAEVYCMPVHGGEAERLTYQGTPCRVCGWTRDGASIVYASAAERAFRRDEWLYTVGPGDLLPQRLPLGPASALSFGPQGMSLIGRNTAEPARWKRYRGGTIGQIWVDAHGDGAYVRLRSLEGNLASPCWVDDRIFFIADHEGVGNVYSCQADGSDVRRHTDHEEFYARALSTDGKRLVYHAGADIYVLDPAQDQARRVDLVLSTSRTQRNRRFVSPGRYLHSVDLEPDGSGLALTSRGKAFVLSNWEGAVRQLGDPEGVRYRLLTWLRDGQRLVAAASDESPHERLVRFAAPQDGAPLESQRLDDLDLGRMLLIEASPAHDRVIVTNHRNELMLVDLEAAPPTARVLDTSGHGRIAGVAWSPDGAWVAYGFPDSLQTTKIKLCRVETGETYDATSPVLHDFNPAFDPKGRYLYFIGQRDFDPVHDQMQFDLGFPRGARPFLVTLREDVPSPFVPLPRPLSPDKKKDEGAKKKPSDLPEPAGDVIGAGDARLDEDVLAESEDRMRIDLDGLSRRVVAFPVAEARYSAIVGLDKKAVFSWFPVEGARRLTDTEGGGPRGILECYDFENQKQERLVDGISSFGLSMDRKTLVYRSGSRLRVLKAGDKPPESKSGAKDGSKPSRQSGWIDLDRVKVSTRPSTEWRQMFREAWRLQREHFWVADMCGIDWDAVYDRYRPLVDRVATRSEFSDLLWELQGELGTSHAYEYGGEYRPAPDYRQGFLGVDWAVDEEGRCVIHRIIEGDPWDARSTSSLAAPAANLRSGDVVLAINGQSVGHRTPPGARLVNLGGSEVELLVQRGQEVRTVTVKALTNERSARYRDWVNEKRRRVHERTSGRVGYIHIPDMSAEGFAEFHRAYLVEYDREGLLIDVRFNGGGNVSGLLLEKLARRRLGYDFPRWGAPVPYPQESPRGPMAALTNEHAGSDGDMFSHAFKMLKLGPLLGVRTWGGVIGIWPRHTLADGTVTTQPEFSFFFDDVGWQIENYGTDPDIEIENAPQDYARSHDAQLERAIDEVIRLLDETPPHTPSPKLHPRFAQPRLKPR